MERMLFRGNSTDEEVCQRPSVIDQRIQLEKTRRTKTYFIPWIFGRCPFAPKPLSIKPIVEPPCFVSFLIIPGEVVKNPSYAVLEVRSVYRCFPL